MFSTTTSNNATINCLNAPVTIVVGPHEKAHKKPFYVHRDVLGRHSALLAGWISVNPNLSSLTLPDHDEDLFHAYAQWLYTGVLRVSQKTPILDARVVLAMCYIMGEKLQDSEFRNVVLEMFIAETQKIEGEEWCKCPSPKIVKIIYEGTKTGSPARRLMVDLYKLYGDGGFREQPDFGTKHRRFLEDLSWEFLRRPSGVRTQVLDLLSAGSSRWYKCLEFPNKIAGKRKKEIEPVDLADDRDSAPGKRARGELEEEQSEEVEQEQSESEEVKKEESESEESKTEERWEYSPVSPVW